MTEPRRSERVRVPHRLPGGVALALTVAMPLSCAYGLVRGWLSVDAVSLGTPVLLRLAASAMAERQRRRRR